MTIQSFVVSGNTIKNLPFVPLNTAPRQTEAKRFYSLFQKQPNSQWKRIRTACFSMPVAYKVWEEFLLFSPEEYSVRRVELERKGAQ